MIVCYPATCWSLKIYTDLRSRCLPRRKLGYIIYIISVNFEVLPIVCLLIINKLTVNTQDLPIPQAAPRGLTLDIDDVVHFESLMDLGMAQLPLGIFSMFFFLV
jgi:hypothetical protein